MSTQFFHQTLISRCCASQWSHLPSSTHEIPMEPCLRILSHVCPTELFTEGHPLRFHSWAFFEAMTSQEKSSQFQHLPTRPGFPGAVAVASSSCSNRSWKPEPRTPMGIVTKPTPINPQRGPLGLSRSLPRNASDPFLTFPTCCNLVNSASLASASASWIWCKW